MDFIEINKLSHLHNGKTIIFCKTDFLHQEFDNIRKLTNDVILISGNSDYPILDHETFVNKINNIKNPYSYNIHLPPWNYFYKIPNNIKKWYAENLFCYHEKLEPLPLGLECTYESKRPGHGIGYFERGCLKEWLLKRNKFVIPKKLIYGNFTLNSHRQLFVDAAQKCDYIDIDPPNLSIEQFFDKILDYEMILCPMGNGLDTHRLWEVLYSHRIPVTLKVADFKLYELYEKLPVIILNDIKQLNDKEYMLQELFRAKLKSAGCNEKILDINYWIDRIQEDAKEIK